MYIQCAYKYILVNVFWPCRVWGGPVPSAIVVYSDGGFVNHIGGQRCVNLSKPGKLFWGPKSDLAWSCQHSAGCNKHIGLRAGAKGFWKTLANSRNIWVWLWPKKVYTWLILVYTDQEFVHTMFAHGETHKCSMERLSINGVVFLTAIVPGALNN